MSSTPEIVTLVQGALENNTYLLADPDARVAVAIDPADGPATLAEAEARGWRLQAIWLTHAHFDHFAGARDLATAFSPALPVLLHPADLPLYLQGGGARMFGLPVPDAPAPEASLAAGQTLRVGAVEAEVRLAPGHSLGHVIFYVPAGQAAFVGDVIFASGIGRTDLPGGSYDTLMESIRAQVISLPPATRLLPGHGPETTVLEETRYNPFL